MKKMIYSLQLECSAEFFTTEFHRNFTLCFYSAGIKFHVISRNSIKQGIPYTGQNSGGNVFQRNNGHSSYNAFHQNYQ